MAGTVVAGFLTDGVYTKNVADIVLGGADAWVNFNGTTSPGTIRAQYNVSSVTKNGTGDYTINFTTPFPDTSYATIGSQKEDESSNTGGNTAFKIARFVQTTSSIRVQTFVTSNGTLLDSIQVNVAVFR